MTSRMSSRTSKQLDQFTAGVEITEENNTVRNKNIAVTVLALERNELPEKEDVSSYEEMPELKLVHEFQTRRKYTKIKKPKEISRDKTVLELGLSGTKYHFVGKSNDAESLKESATERSDGGNGTPEEKVHISSRLTLPPISPRAVRSENTTPAHLNSLLNSDFGFKKNNSDTFSGIYKIPRTIVASELEKELELHANRHIYACHNLGNIRKASRAAQSVLGLKEAMSGGLSNSMSPHELDSYSKGKSYKRRKHPMLYHRPCPSLNQLFLKPTVDPKDGLPVINGSAVLNASSLSECEM